MKDCLIIDYSHISEYIDFLPKPKFKPKNSFQVVLVLICDAKIVEKLKSLPNGKAKLAFVDTEIFKNNIHENYYFYYQPKKSICILEGDCEKYIDIIIKNINLYLPPDTMLCKYITIHKNNTVNENLLKIYIDNGFHSPYITNKLPTGENIYTSLSISRLNKEKEVEHNINIYHKVSDILRQKDDMCCTINTRFSNDAINFLKSASKLGHTKNKDGSSSQKEISGELIVSKIVKENEKIIYIIDVDKRSIQSGGEENVDVNPTRYNFHSHPEEAYVRHSVHKAWPSATDYLGFLQLGLNTIFHTVATIEGLYIISFTCHWGKSLNKVDKKFIKKHYKIKHTEKHTPEQYCNFVNNIKYKNYPIFKVQYLSWEKAREIINVYYPKIAMSCMPTGNILSSFKKLHK